MVMVKFWGVVRLRLSRLTVTSPTLVAWLATLDEVPPPMLTTALPDL